MQNNNKQFLYREFPHAFNLVGLRARFQLRGAVNEINRQHSLPKTLLQNHKEISNNNNGPNTIIPNKGKSIRVSLKLFSEKKKEKPFSQLYKEEINMAPTLISTERKIAKFIKKKFTIKSRSIIKKIPEQTRDSTFQKPETISSLATLRSTNYSSSSTNKGGLHPMSGFPYSGTKNYKSSLSIKPFRRRNSNMNGSMICPSLKRVESQPNLVKLNNSVLSNGDSEPSLYQSLCKPFFKLTSHAIINLSAYHPKRKNNKEMYNSQDYYGDGFDFDTVKYYNYDIIKQKVK